MALDGGSDTMLLSLAVDSTPEVRSIISESHQGFKALVKQVVSRLHIPLTKFCTLVNESRGRVAFV